MDTELAAWAAQRGGARQRDLAASLAELGAAQPLARGKFSILVTVLLEGFASGDVAAYWLQKIAQSAVDDGLNHPEVLKLAAVPTGNLDYQTGGFPPLPPGFRIPTMRYLNFHPGILIIRYQTGGGGPRGREFPLVCARGHRVPWAPPEPL